MKKFIVVLSSIFELVFYTFFMVLIGNVNITNQVISLIVHLLSMIVVASLFYFLIRFIFSKLEMKAKKYIYYMVIANFIVGAIVPVFLIIIIPNEALTTFAFLMVVSTIYYGIFINLVICILNYFLTNRHKKMG